MYLSSVLSLEVMLENYRNFCFSFLPDNVKPCDVMAWNYQGCSAMLLPQLVEIINDLLLAKQGPKTVLSIICGGEGGVLLSDI